MTTEKLKEVLESKIASDEMNDFYVGKIIYKPNACGCININDSWFIYKKMDENCYLSLTGPFFENEIIYACSWLLKKEDLFDEYKTDDFFQKYMHNHFSSIEEIKEKYKLRFEFEDETTAISYIISEVDLMKGGRDILNAIDQKLIEPLGVFLFENKEILDLLPNSRLIASVGKSGLSFAFK